MKARRLNLAILCLAVVVCAVFAREAYHRRQDPALRGDPNQLVVETHYSLPWHEKLCIRRGQDRLLNLPFGFFEGGSLAEEVVKKMGPPKYRLEVMSQEYFVWEDDIRYDWDFEEKFAGSFLSIRFGYDDRIQSVTITPTPPLDARATSLEEFSERLSATAEE